MLHMFITVSCTTLNISYSYTYIYIYIYRFGTCHRKYAQFLFFVPNDIAPVVDAMQILSRNWTTFGWKLIVRRESISTVAGRTRPPCVTKWEALWYRCFLYRNRTYC